MSSEPERHKAGERESNAAAAVAARRRCLCYLNSRHANQFHAHVHVKVLDVRAPAVLADSDVVRQQLLFELIQACLGKPF